MVPFNLDMLALQWGHSFSAVEIRQRSCCSACMCSASMGPQLFSRGDKSDCLKELHSTSRFNGATAFQPWRYIFGRHTPRLGIWLQWGHSFSAVEMALNILAMGVSSASLFSCSMKSILSYFYALFIYSEENPRSASAHSYANHHISARKLLAAIVDPSAFHLHAGERLRPSVTLHLNRQIMTA